jgi:hypothetical protein
MHRSMTASSLPPPCVPATAVADDDLQLEREKVSQLEEELLAANQQISNLQKRIRNLVNSSHRSTTLRRGSNPYRNTCNLLSSWKKNNLSPKQVAEGVVNVMCEKRYLRQ